jgi:Predicted metal-binding protein
MSVLSELNFFFNSSALIFMKTIPFNELSFDNRCEFLCKYGCKNYNHKFCCPPDSHNFLNYIHKKQPNWVLLAATSVKVPQKTSEFQKRFLNIQKEMEIQRISYNLSSIFSEKQIDHIVLSGGSCKKCKICSKIKKQECNKPNLKLTSMEAVGLDCQKTLTDAGFDFEMPARNSINRCMAILFNDENLSSIFWIKENSNQTYKKVSKKEIQGMCSSLHKEFPEMFDSIQLISIPKIKQEGFKCTDKCEHYSKNFSCPPYSTKINFNLWNYCILWKWNENKFKNMGIIKL